MVKSVLVGLLVVPLVLAVALPPVAAHPGRASMSRLQSELGLTDDQVQAIRQLRAGQRDVRVNLYRSLADARRSLRDLILTGADDATVQGQMATVQQLSAQAVQLRVDTLRGISQILTPDQRDKMRQLQEGRNRSTWH
jgi:Spy/CpxP family protein refolding chaperone